MDAGAPWMEALVQGDLPIVELTNYDLLGLDKEDDNLGNQDFGVIEPLVEITSPEQELENVDNLSENSFCMLEPEVRINTPEIEHNDEPELPITEPEVHIDEPELNLDERETEMVSPETENSLPTPNVLSERTVQVETPDVQIVPQEILLDSPEIVTIEDTPEKFTVKEPVNSAHKGPTKQLVFNQDPGYELKELRVKLVRIDESLTIINNTVRIPAHLCDRDLDSMSNGLRSSRASSLSSRMRRERTSTNQRSPYSLRIKTEPAEEDDASYSNEVRFNPYAIAAPKTAANKRTPGGAKAKPTKNRPPQPDDPDNDFLPTDFLEATMSEEDSPAKQQTWPVQGDSNLLKKTLTFADERQTQNGTTIYAAEKMKTGPQRLSSFRSGFVVPEVRDANSLDMLAKVMANSSVSLTHRPKPGSTGRGGGTKRPPGQSGMVNHDHQYSSRLSNENVTRLEAQIKTLQSENRVLKVETETLRKQLAAANAYIGTSLNAAVKPPVRPNQPRGQSQPVRIQPQLGVQPQFRGQPQQFRMQARGYPPPRGRPLGAHTIRRQPMGVQAILPRSCPPLRPTIQKKGNPGVKVVPARAAVPPVALQTLRTSTSALTVIPIRKGPRPSDPEIEMPSFEQVNVNEHFGMHFLTE